MITAEEARKLSGTTAQEEVETLNVRIKEAALKGMREFHLHESFWTNEGYQGTKKYKEAVKILEDLGYKVKFYYADGSFAVDMYTIISW